MKLASGVNALSLRGNGRELVTAADDRTVRIWDSDTGVCLRTVATLERPVMDVAYSPDGKSVAAVAQDGKVRVWDAATGASLLVSKTGVLWRVAFSPDGSRLVAAGLGAGRVWDTVAWRELTTFEGHGGLVVAIAFRPDGAAFATAAYDHKVKIWDVATGGCLGTIDNHTNYAVAFSPDGRRLALSDVDAVVIADAASGETILSMRGSAGDVQQLAFSPDGARLVAANGSGVVNVWETAPWPRSRKRERK